VTLTATDGFVNRFRKLGGLERVAGGTGDGSVCGAYKRGRANPTCRGDDDQKVSPAHFSEITTHEADRKPLID
jgi:hypothetical protein